MKCKRCGKSRQEDKYCTDCKKIRTREANLRYRSKKSMSKTLRKYLGLE